MDERPTTDPEITEQPFDPEMTEEDEANAPDDTGRTASDPEEIGI